MFFKRRTVAPPTNLYTWLDIKPDVTTAELSSILTLALGGLPYAQGDMRGGFPEHVQRHFRVGPHPKVTT
jgi:hypothetical protein